MTRRHKETRAKAKHLRTDFTPSERALWNVLRANRLGIKFQRQVVLPPYIADFAARSERLVIELDGDSHAGREAYDSDRTATLEARGYRVLRFSNSDAMNILDGVTRAILVALGRDPEALPPPLQGERDSRREAAAGSGGNPETP